MNFFNLGSIRKNFALIVFLSILPAIALLFYTGMEQRKVTIENAKSDVMLLTHTMAQTQKEITLSAHETLATLAIMNEFQSLDIQKVDIIFKNLIKRNPNYDNIVLVDLKGNVLASGIPSKGINLADRKQIREALKTKEFATGEYILTRIGNKSPAFPFAYPVIDKNGNIKAVIAVAVQLRIFSEIYQKASVPPNSFVAVTDYQGIRLYYYPAKDSTNPIGKQIKKSSWEIARGAEEPGIITNTGSDGVKRIFAFEPIRLEENTEPYMYVWAGFPEAYIIAPADKTLKRNLLIILITSIGAFFISWFFGRKTLIEPIQKLIDMTEAFAIGNFNRPDNRFERVDEFKKLTDSFYSMAESISKNQIKLQSSEDRFKKLSGLTFEGIAIHNRGIIQDANDSLTDLFGYTREEIIGINAVELLFPEESHSIIYEKISNEIALPYEVTAKKKDGTLFPVEIESRDIIKDDEHFMVSAIRDITKRKEAEQEHKKLLEQLNQAQKMESIGRLAGGVAHDYNNMLVVIIGYAELAMENLSPDNDSQREYLKEIINAAERSSEINRQLLTFARKQTIQPDILDLNERVEGMLKMLRRLIGEDIDMSWQPGMGRMPVFMDPSQLNQLLANLCVNARDAIDGIGKIIIETDHVQFDKAFCKNYPGFNPGDYIVLSVSDDGCGMDKDTRDNIFEPFFTTKAVGKGTGLGLATVYGIVKQNDGFINVYSEPDEGTTFRIYLRRHAGKAGLTKTEEVLNLPISRGETILVVEDEPSILKLAQTILENLGYKVLTASTPGKAAILAQENAGHINLLLTDVVMPEMNGKDLADNLKAHDPKLKVMFMSGYAASIIAGRGLLNSETNFIQKPFSKNALVTKVREVLDRR